MCALYTVLSLIEVHYLISVHPPSFSGILHSKISVAHNLRCLWLPDLSRFGSGFVNTNLKSLQIIITLCQSVVVFNHMFHYFQLERNTVGVPTHVCVNAGANQLISRLGVHHSLSTVHPLS